MKWLTVILILAIVLTVGCTQQPTGQAIGNQTQFPSEQPQEKCIENWSCTSWNECSSSRIQTRTCRDLNSCGTTINKPIESQRCTPLPTCTNECYYVREKRCSGNYTQICGNYDSDECLEWKKDEYCEYGCLNEMCQQPSEEKYIVSYVIDGDTFVLTNSEHVRLIGINAPESSQSCYLEAKNKLNELVDDKEVILEKDVSDKDMYGRLLRYVYVDSLFVNLEMVRLGYANAYEYPPDTKYSIQIANAENEAKTNQYSCIWKPSEEEECITIINFHYDAEGDDCYNLNDEYVTFKNTCSFSIDMNGWTVKDEATHIYTFSTFNLGSGNSITLYTGGGTNTATELHWGSSGYQCNAIWNNDGDTLYLRDANGNLVLSYSY
jgi:endonuclease YncB( thermonuclease family)